MSKGKLAKFADMASYPHVFEYPYSAVDNVPFEMKGKWNESFFGNDRPIVLELGCGRGEYTVGLGRLFPDKNFIGVDIKKFAINIGLINFKGCLLYTSDAADE